MNEFTDHKEWELKDILETTGRIYDEKTSPWAIKEKVTTKQYGHGQGFTCWVFKRNPMIDNDEIVDNRVFDESTWEGHEGEMEQDREGDDEDKEQAEEDREGGKDRTGEAMDSEPTHESQNTDGYSATHSSRFRCTELHTKRTRLFTFGDEFLEKDNVNKIWGATAFTLLEPRYKFSFNAQQLINCTVSIGDIERVIQKAISREVTLGPMGQFILGHHRVDYDKEYEFLFKSVKGFKKMTNMQQFCAITLTSQGRIGLGRLIMVPYLFRISLDGSDVFENFEISLVNSFEKRFTLDKDDIYGAPNPKISFDFGVAEGEEEHLANVYILHETFEGMGMDDDAEEEDEDNGVEEDEDDAKDEEGQGGGWESAEGD